MAEPDTLQIIFVVVTSAAVTPAHSVGWKQFNDRLVRWPI